MLSCIVTMPASQSKTARPRAGRGRRARPRIRSGCNPSAVMRPRLSTLPWPRRTSAASPRACADRGDPIVVVRVLEAVDRFADQEAVRAVEDLVGEVDARRQRLGAGDDGAGYDLAVASSAAAATALPRLRRAARLRRRRVGGSGDGGSRFARRRRGAAAGGARVGPRLRRRRRRFGDAAPGGAGISVSVAVSGVASGVVAQFDGPQRPTPRCSASDSASATPARGACAQPEPRHRVRRSGPKRWWRRR